MSAKRPKLLGALLITIIVACAIVWWVRALVNEDPLWFLRSFTAEADWITVYWDGTTHMYFPGDQTYEEIMTVFSGAIAQWSGYEGDVRFADQDLEQCRQRERLLELHYNTPVQVHTRHLFPEARYFYVPFSGIHSDYHRVFAGFSDEPRTGALNISEKRFSSLLEIVGEAAP